MRTVMAVAITGALAVWLANPALAAKVVTKYGTYEGGCQSSSCLYKPMKTKEAEDPLMVLSLGRREAEPVSGRRPAKAGTPPFHFATPLVDRARSGPWATAAEW